MEDDEATFRMLSIFDDETVPIEPGGLQWLPLRRRLGIRSFGTNAYRAARAGDAVVEEHVESPGHEELYVVVRGRARFQVGEKVTEAAAGSAVFIPQPDVRRGAVALEEDTVVLAVGGWPGKPYHPLPWETIYLAQASMRAGDWARAAEILEREAGEHRQHPYVRFHLARCRARLGHLEQAMEELRAAIEARPELRERAAGSEDLEPLRGLEGSTIEGRGS